MTDLDRLAEMAEDANADPSDRFLPDARQVVACVPALIAVAAHINEWGICPLCHCWPHVETCPMHALDAKLAEVISDVPRD